MLLVVAARKAKHRLRGLEEGARSVAQAPSAVLTDTEVARLRPRVAARQQPAEASQRVVSLPQAAAQRQAAALLAGQAESRRGVAFQRVAKQQAAWQLGVLQPEAKRPPAAQQQEVPAHQAAAQQREVPAHRAAAQQREAKRPLAAQQQEAKRPPAAQQREVPAHRVARRRPVEAPVRCRARVAARPRR